MLVGSGVHDVDVNDIRRTVATEIAAMGYSSDVVSGLLSHAPATVTRRHYDHHQYEPQKRQALEAWAARLERIVGGTGHVDKEGSPMFGSRPPSRFRSWPQGSPPRFLSSLIDVAGIEASHVFDVGRLQSPTYLAQL